MAKHLEVIDHTYSSIWIAQLYIDYIVGLYMTMSIMYILQSNSLRASGLQPTRLLCPWDFSGNAGEDCHFLPLCLLHCCQILHLLMWIADSLEKTPKLGKNEGKKRKERQRMRQLDSITNSKDMSLSKLWKILKHSEAWQDAGHGIKESDTTQ